MDVKKMRLKVYIRLRPVNSQSVSGGPGDALSGKNGIVKPEHKIMYLSDPDKPGNSSEFVFDRIFDSGTSQGSLFEEASIHTSVLLDYMHADYGVAVVAHYKYLNHDLYITGWQAICRACTTWLQCVLSGIWTDRWGLYNGNRIGYGMRMVMNCCCGHA